MNILLTSSGIANASIEAALVDLMGKPIEEASALFVPTGIYPYAGGANFGYRAITGSVGGRMAAAGWGSLGVLELSVLPSIDEDAWVPMLRETDALLVWGGDPVFLAHWLRESGVAAQLPSLQNTVYVGTSAGAIATAGTFVESYSNPPKRDGAILANESSVIDTSEGPVTVQMVTAKGLGLVNFGVIPHLDEPNHEDASMANAEKWAARIPAPTYAIDDQTAIKVVGGAVEVISEGHWKLFNA